MGAKRVATCRQSYSSTVYTRNTRRDVHYVKKKCVGSTSTYNIVLDY